MVRLGASAGVLAAALAAGLMDAAIVGAQSSSAPRALVAEYDGIIHPVAAEYIADAITRADSEGAALTLLVLRTPGGLLESTRDIVSRILAARAPVVVFVGPTGARAASAGFLIVLAADVAVLAPGTHIGAAHPVAAGGGATSETLEKKAVSDAAAYARSLAAMRGRNEKLAAEAVTESRSFTHREALEASPPLADLSAQDVEGALRALDGRTVRRADGRQVELQTQGMAVERVEMTRRQHFLSAIAHPQIALLLLSLGMLGLTVELWNPGGIVPGVVGGLCLLLAFFAFQVLPVDVVGLLLVGLGVALLLLELKVPSFGVLGIGGAVCLFMGAVMLTDEIPGVEVGYDVIVAVVGAMAVVLLFLGRLALVSQRRAPVTGAHGLVGEMGTTLGALTPGEAGQIRVHGEIWRAVSPSAVAPGQRVVVTGVHGLTLSIEPAASTPEGASP
jgi:membrane-bound serine protease (ClpP class)